MSNIFKNDQMTPELNKEMNDLFMSELSKNIRPTQKDDLQKISDEIDNAEGSMAFFSGGYTTDSGEMDALIRSQNRGRKKVASDVNLGGNENEEADDSMSFLSREQLLENLRLVYSNLIDLFKSVGLNDKNSEPLIDSIQAIEKSINMVGGEIEQPFAPEDFVSGLESPDTGNDAEEKARRVIANTIKFYKAGVVSDIDIAVNEKDEKYIKAVFSGHCRSNSGSGKQAYTATGYIGPISQFIGVEAIDYIYRAPNGGSMYVRSFEGGRWINKSNDFNIIFDEFDVGEDSGNKKSSENNDEHHHTRHLDTSDNSLSEVEEEELLDFEIKEK